MTVFKRLLLVLVCVLFISGCTPMINMPTQANPPTANTVPQSSTILPTEHTGPLLVKDYLGDFPPLTDKIANYEVIIPENNVLILTGRESLKKVFVDGDVYITATAEVSFHDVYVRGKVYCHGILRGSGLSEYQVFVYYTNFNGAFFCSAYDGVHGQFISEPGASGSTFVVANDALDYAFDKWGNFGPSVQQTDLVVSQTRVEPQIIQHGDSSKIYPDAFIFTGEGLVSDQKIYGDVYITSNAKIEFENVHVYGDIYCYGQLKLSKRELRLPGSISNNAVNTMYAYSFNESCESFDGVHGLITGGPIICEKLVISDNALDYAFEIFGKQ